MIRSVQIIALLIISALIPALCACTDSRSSPGISVMLLESGNYTVESENPMKILPGGKAVFKIGMPSEYVCISLSSGASYDAESGTLTVENVKYPTTISMNAGPEPKRLLFDFEYAGGGQIGSNIETGRHYAGSGITVSATPSEGYRFDGWSLKSSIASGGRVVSYDSEYSFILTENIVLYPNFAREDYFPPVQTRLKYCDIRYYPNGGAIKDGDADSLVINTAVPYYYPNCLHSNGTFTREGYQLIEYNTKADGSGEAYSLGSKIIADISKETALYCIWVKESDPSLFEVADSSGGVAITDYSGDEKMLVIPERIDGKTVVEIRRGAIKATNAETVVLPNTIRTVASGAFETTEKFTTLYLCDNVRNIANDSFTNMKAMRNYRLNSATLPKFDSAPGMGSKWERLVHAEGKRIIVNSGSSSNLGLSTQIMEHLVGHDYTLVNYGTNFESSSIFYLELICHYMREGDIFVHAPEMVEMTMGSNHVNAKLYSHLETYYNCWRAIDATRLSNILSALRDFNNQRAQMMTLGYGYTTPYMDANGDYKTSEKMNRDSFHAGSSFTLRTDIISGTRKDALNRVYGEMVKKGGHVYFSFAPCNANAFASGENTEAKRAAYINALGDALVIPVISDIKNYILPGRLMSDSDYHVNTTGRSIRTKQLYLDIKAQMEREGLKFGATKAEDVEFDKY